MELTTKPKCARRQLPQVAPQTRRTQSNYRYGAQARSTGVQDVEVRYRIRRPRSGTLRSQIPPTTNEVAHEAGCSFKSSSHTIAGSFGLSFWRPLGRKFENYFREWLDR